MYLTLFEVCDRTDSALLSLCIVMVSQSGSCIWYYFCALSQRSALPPALLAPPPAPLFPALPPAGYAKTVCDCTYCAAVTVYCDGLAVWYLWYDGGGLGGAEHPQLKLYVVVWYCYGALPRRSFRSASGKSQAALQ